MPFSPALANICNNVIINLEPNINPFSALPSIISQTQESQECEANPPEYYYEKMEESGLTIGQDVELEEVDSGPNSCPFMLDARDDMGTTDLFLDKEHERKQRLTIPGYSEEHDYSTHMWDQDYLSYSDLQFMKSFQSDILPTASIENKYKWVKYYKNRADPRKSRIGLVSSTVMEKSCYRSLLVQTWASQFRLSSYCTIWKFHYFSFSIT